MIVDPEYGTLFAPVKHLPDGRIAYVATLTFGRARLCIGDKSSVYDGY